MKKKLVFIITKSEVGGAQTWVYELKKLLEQYYECFLITSSNGWLTSKFDYARVTTISEIASLAKPQAIYKIVNALSKISADVVISNSVNAGIYSRLAKIAYRHKHIYVSHGWSCIYNGKRLTKIFCLIEKAFSYFTDKILCVSDNDKENALNIIGINEKKSL